MSFIAESIKEVAQKEAAWDCNNECREGESVVGGFTSLLSRRVDV